MGQQRKSGNATSEQLDALVRETNSLIDGGHRDLRLRELPSEVQRHFLAQAEHRTLGEPPGGYRLALRRYPDTTYWSQASASRLIDGHDALVQIRCDGTFADPDRSFIRVLYGIANTASDEAKPNYVARRDLINHYGYTFRTIDLRQKGPHEPLTADDLALRGLLGAFSALEQKPGFTDVDFANALSVTRTGQNLTTEEVARVEADRARQDQAANMNREFGFLDVSAEEAVALSGVLQYVRQLPAGAPELSSRPLPRIV